MDQKMTERKALLHALMTVGAAALLVLAALLYLMQSYSDLWLAVITIIVIAALILFPFIYRKYMKGPPPPLTQGQHIGRAVMFGVLTSIFVAEILQEHYRGWRLFEKSCVTGGWLLISLNHLWLAYKKEGHHRHTNESC